MSARRVRAIFRKELREYRRNRQIVVSMAVLPLVFSVYPSIQILALPASEAGVLLHRQPLVYMLALPAIIPAVVAAYSVAGGKALAALVPSLAVSYGVLSVFVGAMALFAQPPVASALLAGPALLVQLLFTPLVAALSIWAGIAISARSSDPRVPRPRPRGGNAGPRRAGLADRLPDVRPRAAHHGDQIVTCARI